MARRSRAGGYNARVSGTHPGSEAVPATVASLGVQVRLVAVESEGEPELAGLLHRYQGVCAEWERLIRQTRDLLGLDQSANAGANLKSAPAPAAHAGDDRTAASPTQKHAVVAPDAGPDSSS
ncbi:hypothetical protein JKG68_30495 [Microvirga aerilata]|uniref:Uncharacterized protein n=1 Tax=Microvirga aerilata TaxID=670292 RepID=A0A936ZLF0_9HYPH|nr:hypothetical protein [Microvirga aerilata]MBL0408215.1 hypothetical protein [Microvirga aerilata]